MKKTGVILVAIISLILASCDVDWDKLYPESQNPDLDENYFVITKTLPETLKLTGNLDENQMVALFDFEKMQFLKDDYVAFEMEISNEKEFYNYSKVGTIINENHVFAKASDLLDIFQRMFYIEDSRVMYIRYIAYKINSNDSKTRIGAYEQYFGETTVTVTLIIIEQDYYLVGNMNGWDYYHPLRFNHSDKDVYDDPVFTIDVMVPDNCSWKIMPNSYTDSWNGLFGVETEGDESTEGKLIKDGKSGMIAKSGWYRFTINMLDNKYNIEFLGDSSEPGGSYLYIIGSNNGWDISNGDYFLSSPDNDNVYSGVVKMPGSCDFRFYSALGDWSIGSNGANDNDGYSNYVYVDDGGIYKTEIVKDGQKCWTIFNDGSYYMQADLNNYILFINKLDPNEVFLIGNCNDWVFSDTSCRLINFNPTGTNYNYVGYSIDMKDAGDGYSYFRINTDQSWASQFGSVSGSEETMNVEGGYAKTKIKPESEGCFVLPAGIYNISVDFVNGTIEAIAL